MGQDNLRFSTEGVLYLGNGTERPIVTMDREQEVISTDRRVGYNNLE